MEVRDAMNEAGDRAADLVRSLAHGRWRAQALEVMLRLGIPELLGDEARSAAEIAALLEASPDGIARLLRLLVALGLLAEDGGRFRNTEASLLLCADHPRTLRRDALHTLSPSGRTAWDALEHSVRRGWCGFEAATGVPLREHLATHPEEADVVHAYRAGVAAHNAGALLAGHDFPAAGAAVVVGAHNAPALVEILRRRPGLRGVLADAPQALARFAPDRVEPEIRGRLTVASCAHTGAVPAGGDVYVLLHVLHDWPDAEAVEILGAIAAAMGPRSELVILAAAGREAGARLLPAYLDLHAMVAFGGRERGVEEHRELLAAAGLELTAAATPEQRPGIAVLTARPAG
jgi:hypothetical protein